MKGANWFEVGDIVSRDGTDEWLVVKVWPDDPSDPPAPVGPVLHQGTEALGGRPTLGRGGG